MRDDRVGSKPDRCSTVVTTCLRGDDSSCCHTGRPSSRGVVILTIPCAGGSIWRRAAKLPCWHAGRATRGKVSMKTIAVISQKGGAGKTTIALGLAVEAERAGLATVIFDLDPQGSAATWADARGQGNPPDVVAAQAPRLPVLLDSAARQGAQLAIIDTPPHADTAALAAAQSSDLVLIPCRPSALDLAAIASTVRLAAEIANKPVVVVLNAVPVRSLLGDEAASALTAAGVQLAPVRLHQRTDFVTPLAAGRTAAEWSAKGKAATETADLWAYLRDALTPDRIATLTASGKGSNPPEHQGTSPAGQHGIYEIDQQEGMTTWPQDHVPP
jgi:chromosome partitioning protein